MWKKRAVLDFPCEFWKKERVAETIGTKVYEGALFDPNSGQMHPGDWCDCSRRRNRRQHIRSSSST